jgi:carbonic anhydrase
MSLQKLIALTACLSSLARS